MVEPIAMNGHMMCAEDTDGDGIPNSEVVLNSNCMLMLVC